ncbi:putative toxin-antitoxin system toxin component, PIN family [Candidatus Woesearchaeota archaeon]|nr:putative toxin-antitoxin system toxin component, PIN family [Candidatus Woesearchaeota archaeon]
MKVTLDTNVLVSGTFWTGDSFRILDMIDQKRIKNITSKDIIQEYYETMKSGEIVDKIQNKNLVMAKIVNKVVKISVFVEPAKRLSIIKDDPDDNKILECAKSGKVDCIISQDEHLLKLRKFEGISIVRPKEFLELFK